MERILLLCPKVLLTFDCEDFVNDRATYALRWVLQCLNKNSLKGLFFITGSMAEKLSFYPDIVELLSNHVIGYHSSAHSVRPTLVEYADVPSFEVARELTKKRETSHVNPVTGKLEGKGGLLAVKSLFSNKEIEAFRAPGFCWSPPILMAMKDLGLKYDFSTNVSSSPISRKGITFYPLPMNQMTKKGLPGLIRLIPCIDKAVIVLYTHPNGFVNSVHWDSMYYKGNPITLTTVLPRTSSDAQAIFRKWALIIREVSYLQKTKVMDASLGLSCGYEKELEPEVITGEYRRSMQWLKRFGYNPRNVLNHYFEFFS